MWQKIDEQVKSLDGKQATTRDALYSESSSPRRPSWNKPGRLSGVRAGDARAPDEVVPFQAIRVEVWRLIYDKASTRLSTQKIMETTVSRPRESR